MMTLTPRRWRLIAPLAIALAFAGRGWADDPAGGEWVRVGPSSGERFAGNSPHFLYAGFSPAENPAPAKNPPVAARPTASDNPPPAEGAQAAPEGADLPTHIKPKYGPELENLTRQFMSTGKKVQDRPGGEDLVQFKKSAAGKPRLFEVLSATSESNPLLDEQCKTQAMQFSVEALQRAMGLENKDAALREAAAHIQKHLDDIKNMGSKISYSQYLKTIADCRTFCAPLVANLVQCHVLAVSRHDHGIILFEINRYDLQPPFSGPDGLIERVAARLRGSADKHVLVIGRASQIGDLRYNRRLSGLRALAVKDGLVNAGVPAERIETTWFGWEPPQIDSPIAQLYGLQDLFGRVGALAINQSVVMVLYDAPGAAPIARREARR